MSVLDIINNRRWLKIALVLVIVTILYNTAEGVIAICSGVYAKSIALEGFGVDSLIEVSAAGLFLWRLLKEINGDDPEAIEEREQFTRKFIGWTFIALSLYIAIEAGYDIWFQKAPERSLMGIVVASLSVMVMPLLAYGKIKAAKHIGSEALRLEAKESIACGFLSLFVLIGLIANAFLAWWWADPIAALLMTPWLIREGTEAIKGESCCGCHAKNT